MLSCSDQTLKFIFSFQSRYQYITRVLIILDTFWNSQCLILNYQIVQSSHWLPFYSLHLHFWLLWPNKQFPAKTITWNKKDTGKIKVNSDYFKYRMQHKHNVSWIFPYLRKTNKIREIFPKINEIFPNSRKLPEGKYSVGIYSWHPSHLLPIDRLKD